MDRDQGPGVRGRERNPRSGWALAELLVAVVLTGFFSVVLLQATVALQRSLGHWETSVRLRQTLSASLFRMCRDFRVAGCNPLGGTVPDETAVLEDGGDRPERVRVRMDKRGNGRGTPPDGDMTDPDESVEYRWDDRNHVLRRNNQPVAMKIVRNAGEVPLFRLLREGSRGLIRVSVTARDGTESMALSSAVCIRNTVP